MPATANRDLASVGLWELSLERSQRRRALANTARREISRRKTASFAVSAAVAAAPVWPSVAGSADLSKSDATKLAKKLHHRHVDRILLKAGDSNSAVVSLQRALGISADSIYGPQTKAAVKAFQQREGLRDSGDVDVRTWLKLFPNDLIVYASPSAKKALGLGESQGSQWTAVTMPQGGAAAGAAKAGHGKGSSHGSGSKALASAASLDVPDAEDGSPDASVPALPGVDVSPPSGAPGVGAPSPSPPGGGAPTPEGGEPGTGPVPLPPPDSTAGELIRTMVAAANRIDNHHYAYSWGGGHNSSFGGPYDCSGAVSAVLHAAGLLKAPMVSGDFMHWGAPGRGAVTLYANAGHVYMSINGKFFGTTHENPGGGAGWFSGGPRPGFAVVHVPFEKMHLKDRSKAKWKAKKRRRRGQNGVRQPAQPPVPLYGDGESSGGSGYSPPPESSPQPGPSQPVQPQPVPQPDPVPTGSPPGSGVTTPSPPPAPVQQTPAPAPPPEQHAPAAQAPATGTGPAPAANPAPAPEPVSAPEAPAAPQAPSAPAAPEQPAAPETPQAPATPSSGPATGSGESANPTGDAGAGSPETAGTKPAETPAKSDSGTPTTD